jgi:hypothetical protein
MLWYIVVEGWKLQFKQRTQSSQKIVSAPGLNRRGDLPISMPLLAGAENSASKDQSNGL